MTSLLLDRHREANGSQAKWHPLTITNGPLSQRYYDNLAILFYLKLKLKQNSRYMRRAVTKQTIKQGKSSLLPKSLGAVVNTQVSRL